MQSKEYLRKSARPVSNYLDMEMPVGSETAATLDYVEALYIKAIIDRDYTTIIEIGAYDGARAIKIKEFFPDKTVYALDILKNYPNRKIQEVNFVPFSLDFFKEHNAPKTLVLCQGTLTHFRPDELQNFLQTLYAAKIDLFFIEPNTFIENSKSTFRSKNSYYHPYHKTLQQLGFNLENNFNDAIKHIGTIYERRYINIAKT